MNFALKYVHLIGCIAALVLTNSLNTASAQEEDPTVIDSAVSSHLPALKRFSKVLPSTAPESEDKQHHFRLEMALGARSDNPNDHPETKNSSVDITPIQSILAAYAIDLKKSNQPPFLNSFSKLDTTQFYARYRFSVSDSSLRVSQSFAALFFSENTQAGLDEIKRRSDAMSLDEKLWVGQLVGWILSYGYDMSRAENKDDTSIVTVDTLFKTAQNNLIYMSNYTGANKSVSGVCRDIAVAQAQVLQQMGLDSVYVVAFKTPDAGHAVVIARDPVTRALYRYNYSSIYRTDYGDSRDLFWGRSIHEDMSISHRLADPQTGRLVTIQNAESGRVLFDAMGFERLAVEEKNHRIMLYEFRNTLAEIPVLGTLEASLRLGTARDGYNGDWTFVGVTSAITTPIHAFQIAQMKHWGGVLLANQNRNAEAFSPAAYLSSIQLLLSAVEERITSENWQLTPALKAQLEARLLAYGVSYLVHNESGTSLDNSSDGSTRTEAVAKLHAGVPDSRLQFDLETRARSYLDGQEMRGSRTDWKNYGFSPVEWIFSPEGRLRLSRSPLGRSYLVAAATLLVANVGDRAACSLAWQYDWQYGVEVFARGRIHEEMPTYFEGAERRVGAAINYFASPRIGIRLQSSLRVGRDHSLSNPRIDSQVEAHF